MGVGGNGGNSCGSGQVWDPKNNSHVEGLVREAEFSAVLNVHVISVVK